MNELRQGRWIDQSEKMHSAAQERYPKAFLDALDLIETYMYFLLSIVSLIVM
jgi:hypothetical protein